MNEFEENGKFEYIKTLSLTLNGRQSSSDKKHNIS